MKRWNRVAYLYITLTSANGQSLLEEFTEWERYVTPSKNTARQQSVGKGKVKTYLAAAESGAPGSLGT